MENRKDRKSLLNKIKAIAIVLATGPALSGCDIHIDDDVLEKLGITVTVDNDGNINVESEEPKVESTTTYTQTLSSTTTTTTTTTSAIVTTTPITSKVVSTTALVTTMPQATTTTTSKELPVVSHIDFNMEYCHDWFLNQEFEFTVSNADQEVVIGEQYPGLWTISNCFCPDDMSRDEFIEELRRYNNLVDGVYYKGQTIKVPGRFLVYNGTLSIDELSSMLGVSKDVLYKINNLSDSLEKKHLFETRNLVVKSIAKDAKSFKFNNVEYKILNDKCFNDDHIIPCKNYSSDADFSIISLYNNSADHTSCFINSVNKDGTYNLCKIADNVDEVYTVNSIPVFKTNSLTTCLAKSLLNEYVPESYETVINIINPDYFNSIYFYKDSNGNVCFTFYPVDLTMYGFTKADEEAYKYFRKERYYAQDETGVDYSKSGFNALIHQSTLFSEDEFYKSRQKVK